MIRQSRAGFFYWNSKTLGSLWASFKRKVTSRTYLTSPWRPPNKLKIKTCNFSWKIVWCRCLSQFSFEDLCKDVSYGKRTLSSPSPRGQKMPNQNWVNSRKWGKTYETASPSQTAGITNFTLPLESFWLPALKF